MDVWRVGEAKQRFSEVLRQSSEAPQRIFRRDHFVAAVIAADLFEEFERWLDQQRRRTLGESFGEVREICREDGYALDTGTRRDRPGWISDGE